MHGMLCMDRAYIVLVMMLVQHPCVESVHLSEME